MYSREFRGKNLLGFIICIVLATIIILLSIRVGNIDLTKPHGMGGDSYLGSLLAKSIVENGIMGLWFAPRLGAPEISSFVDTPFLDLNFGLQFYLLSRINPNIHWIHFMQYFFGYALCACTMYLLLNRYTDNVLIKSILSLCFAITPYHFMRGMGHQTLSNYFIIPLFIYVMDVIYREPFQGIVPERYKGRYIKTIVLYLSCLVVGISNVYYVFAALLCMMMALLCKVIRKKRLTPLLQEGVPIYVTVIGLLIGLTPKLYYSVRYGANTSAGIRLPLESELYGLKIIQMILPCNYNRVNILARMNNQYTSSAININENVTSSLGLFGTVGFFLACSWVILCIVTHERITTENNNHEMTLDITALSILALVLYSAPGGFNALVNYYITPELRAYNRLSVVICGLCICVLCFQLDIIVNEKEKWKKRLCILVLLLAFIFVLYSEIPFNQPDWQTDLVNIDTINTEFFSKVENAMNEGEMIYELPFMLFPEAGRINNMDEYQPALGYIYTDTLRWSYGGMKGRNWAAENLAVDGGQSNDFIIGIQGAGFSGVYIDTSGFEDNGESIIAFYTENLGLKPIVSDDKQLYFFDIRDVIIDE